jgi:hypothetical protein
MENRENLNPPFLLAFRPKVKPWHFGPSRRGPPAPLLLSPPSRHGPARRPTAQPPFPPPTPAACFPLPPSPSRLGPEPRRPNSARPSRQCVGAARSLGRCGWRFWQSSPLHVGPACKPQSHPLFISLSPPQHFFLLSPSLSSPRTSIVASIRSALVPR